VSAARRPRPIFWGAELALAIVAGAAAFTLVTVALELAGPDVLVGLVAAVCVAAVVAVERHAGIGYAVPAAIAALVAFDWYQFPPTHPFGFPDAENLAGLLVYLGVAALIGALAAYGARRADVSEAARSRLAETISAGATPRATSVATRRSAACSSASRLRAASDTSARRAP